MSDFLTFKGKIKVFNDNGNVYYDGTNTITKLFQEMVATMGIDSVYCMGQPFEAGQSFLTSYGMGNSEYLDYSRTEQLVTAYFLNLTPQEQKALTSDSLLLPLYKPNSVELDTSKIVGYASAKYKATSPKEGYLEPITGVNLVNPRSHGLQFKWDAGVMNGEYNTICIGMNVLTDPYNGFRVYRGLEYNNQVLGEIAAGGYFLRPGIKSSDGEVVWTGDTEILLGNSEVANKARLSLNLLTGELKPLDPSSPQYDLQLYLAKDAQLLHRGNFVVIVGGRSVQIFDIKTKAQKKTISGYSFFENGGYVYINNSANSFYSYNPDTYNREGASKTADELGIPKEYQQDSSSNGYLSVLQLDSSEYLVKNVPERASGALSMNPCRAFICTDITRASSTVKEIVPTLLGNCVWKMQGQIYYGATLFNVMNSYSGKYRYMNSTSSPLDILKGGAKFSTAPLGGNMLSFKTFDVPQKIDETQGLHLKYSYSFEQ